MELAAMGSSPSNEAAKGNLSSIGRKVFLNTVAIAR
jgi:hypothetical protein